MEYTEINTNKLPKVLYRILEKYHSQYGLQVIAWARMPGSCAYSFYLPFLRDEEMNLRYYTSLNSKYVLTFYQLDDLGIPAWDAGEQLSYKPFFTRQCRTQEMVEWLEKHLTIQQFIDDHIKGIQAWRKETIVDATNRFLLAWKILCRLASDNKTQIETLYRSDEDCSIHPKLPTISDLNKIGCPRPTEELHYCNGLWISNQAMACNPLNHTYLDIFALKDKGLDTSDILKKLAEFAR